MISIKKAAMCTALGIMFGASTAHATYTPVVTTSGNNFTMLSTSGGLQGGTNDVTFTWDGTFYTSVAAADAGGANATISSPTTFFSFNWTAHHVKIYGPGSYNLYTGCTANNAACGAGAVYTLTVPTGYVGGHMLFDWNTSTNIDVIQLWKMNDSWTNVAGTFGTTPNPFCNNVVGGAGCVNPSSLPAGSNIKTKVWNAASMDAGTDADNWPGALMLNGDGPFIGSSANFNLQGLQATPLVSSVPVPAAAWLLGSGLLSLIGLARRKAA